MRLISRIPGFSLVEVALALGIVAFGLIALMSLLPTGLNLAKQTADEAAAVSILSDESTRLDEAENGVPVYFNANGMRMSSADGAAYRAVWEFLTNALPPSARITVEWPAQGTNSTGRVQTIVVIP